MIAVAGFNAAVDKFLEVDSLRLGEVNRARSVQTWPGGKGLHVALTIAALGEPVRLVGPIDAAHSTEFYRFLSARGVECVGIDVGSTLRTNLAIRDAEGRITEIVEPGPQLDGAVCERLLGVFADAAGQASVAVMSGSLPRGMDESTYHDLIVGLQARGVRCILDTSGTPLRRGLAAGPYLVKPNRDEAEALLGRAIGDRREALEALGAIEGWRLSRIVLTLGGEGAVALWDGRRCRITAPVIQAQNAVGSGDCFLGGLAVGLQRGLAPTETLRLAAACGAASAMTAETGILRREDVAALAPEVEIEWFDARP